MYLKTSIRYSWLYSLFGFPLFSTNDQQPFSCSPFLADGRCLGFRDKEVQGTCLGMRDKEVQGTCLRMRDKEVKGYMSRNAWHRLECGQVGLSTYLGNKFLSYILTYWCNCSATIKSSFSFWKVWNGHVCLWVWLLGVIGWIVKISEMRERERERQVGVGGGGGIGKSWTFFKLESLG